MRTLGRLGAITIALLLASRASATTLEPRSPGPIHPPRSSPSPDPWLCIHLSPFFCDGLWPKLEPPAPSPAPRPTKPLATDRARR